MASVLNSDLAIKMSIKIIDTFIAMRKYFMDQGNILYRLRNVEQKQLEYEIKIDTLFDALGNNEKFKQGIFFDGQVFDAYRFVADIVRKADKDIMVIDNYVDDSVLEMLTKRKDKVTATIFTKNIWFIRN